MEINITDPCSPPTSAVLQIVKSNIELKQTRNIQRFSEGIVKLYAYPLNPKLVRVRKMSQKRVFLFVLVGVFMLSIVILSGNLILK